MSVTPTQRRAGRAPGPVPPDDVENSLPPVVPEDEEPTRPNSPAAGGAGRRRVEPLAADREPTRLPPVVPEADEPNSAAARSCRTTTTRRRRPWSGGRPSVRRRPPEVRRTTPTSRRSREAADEPDGRADAASRRRAVPSRRTTTRSDDPVRTDAERSRAAGRSSDVRSSRGRPAPSCSRACCARCSASRWWSRCARPARPTSAAMRQDDLVRILDETTNRGDALARESADLARERDELLSGSDRRQAALDAAAPQRRDPGHPHRPAAGRGPGRGGHAHGARRLHQADHDAQHARGDAQRGRGGDRSSTASGSPRAARSRARAARSSSTASTLDGAVPLDRDRRPGHHRARRCRSPAARWPRCATTGARATVERADLVEVTPSASCRTRCTRRRCPPQGD